MAVVEPERVFNPIEALASSLIAAVGNPGVLQEDRWTEIAVRIPQ
jgi:hypothetical protein